MQTLSASISKWWQTILISWTKYTTYRFNFFLQVIGPALVFFFVKYNLWNAIYSSNQAMVIQGYTLTQMLSYHAWGLIVGLMSQGHASMNLSEDIRLGRISSYLIYPFNFWEFHTAGFVAFQLLQLFIALVTLVILIMTSFVLLPSWDVLACGLGFAFYVGFFWYSMQYLAGLMAFWLEETWVLRVILNIITAFLSGAIIPLELYPTSFVNVLKYTPFPYLTYFPIKIFMGATELLPMAFGMISIWMLLFCWFNHMVWKKGLRLYTAAGM